MSAEWVHDDHITMTKNEDFYDADSIKIPKLNYVMMTDANARLNAFQAGQVDSINVNAEQIKQLEALNEPVYSYTDNSNWYFQYNIEGNKILSNAKIR